MISGLSFDVRFRGTPFDVRLEPKSLVARVVVVVVVGDTKVDSETNSHLGRRVSQIRALFRPE